MSSAFTTPLRSLLCAILLIFSAASAHAVGLLRDPDIERGLRELANPILRAAGLSPSRVKILLVDDRKLNAFVVDQRHIFVNSGLVMKVSSAGQLQAIIAHEAAHIANGHISRRIVNTRIANRATAFGALIAAAAAIGGAPEAAVGAAAGTASSANRVLLSHTRSEESSADQSALRYLASAGVSAKSMAEVLDIFRGQEALSVGRQDPYARSHPLSRDRQRAVNAYASTQADKPASKSAQYWFDRVQGKLTAFERAPNWTLRRAKGNADTALMRQAVALHRQTKTRKATATIAKLVAQRPKDPYYRELQGQILLESRQFGAAIKAYERAVSLAPNDALILGSYGRALLAQNTKSGNAKALKILVKARSRDSRDGRILRDLGTAYARAGKRGLAVLATAERYALRGDLKNAGIQGKRAVGLLPRGSAAWQRADDLARLAR